MAEIEARKLSRPGVTLAIDEPYQHYQFAGRADLVAWDRDRRALLHIENKTRLVDLQEMAGAFNAKRAYLPRSLADRAGIGPRGWESVTHALVVLWSSEVLHVLRLRPATFEALCPSPVDAFAAWWSGRPPPAGEWRCLVVLDPSSEPAPRRAIFVGRDRIGTLGARYRGYADAARVVDRRRAGRDSG